MKKKKIREGKKRATGISEKGRPVFLRALLVLPRHAKETPL